MTGGDRDLARLRELLAGDGILRGTPAEPIVHPDGSVAPWMLYTWNVSLRPDGLQVAARCLLDRLRGYSSTQLAAHGMTGLPLLAGCVAAGDGRYSGVAIRHAPKAYLSRRQVEGPLDRSRSVVVIDDSLSSGTALRAAITALEAQGCTVEGALVLVNFPNRSGLEWATAAGYRVEALFDVAADLGQELYRARLPPAPLPPAPGVGLPDGLPPAVLARRVAEHVLSTGTRPTPPRTLDADHDGRGGVFVSFRRAVDDHRLARSGLWHFDGEAADAARDVVDATVTTLREAGGAIRRADLDQLKIGVTFLGPMVEILPRELDFDRWAIVVRDRDGRRAGGALPHTQVFTSEVEQYRHAWQRNAGIGPTEPHRLYRQAVDKCVEPGVKWPHYGAADPPELGWTRDAAVGAALTGWARALLADPSRPVPDVTLGSPVDGVAVTLYRRGAGTVAATLSWTAGPVTDGIRDAVARLLARPDAAEFANPEVAVMVSVLHEPERLGADERLVVQKARRGLDAVRVDSADTTRVLLPGALVYNGLSKERFVAAAAAGLPASQRAFTTYRTAQWLNDGGCCRRIRSGFPVREPGPDDPVTDIRALAGFIRRNLSAGGVPLYRMELISGERSWRGTGPRQLHALMGLDRAGELLGDRDWRQRAAAGIGTYVAGTDDTTGGFAADRGGPLADAILLAAVPADHRLAGHPQVQRAARRLSSWLDPFGRITPVPIRLGNTPDLEFLPGAVLVALAGRPDLLDSVPADLLATVLDHQRRRFRTLRGWGHVGWQLQGWAAVFARRQRDDQAAFVFELADWALDRQLDTTGAFLENLSPDEPSFNTGFIAEGIAAAWQVAVSAGDDVAAGRYAASWRAANRFMRTLLVRPEDTFAAADPAAALGGVRLTNSVAQLRADSGSHWLNALVAGVALDRAAAEGRPGRSAQPGRTTPLR